MAPKIFRLVLLTVFTVLAGVYLLRPPVHGFADNGDFWRVMVPAGIEYEITPPRSQSIVRKFSFGPASLLSTTTSAVLLAYGAAKVFALFSGSFDLRWLSAFYLLVFVTGLAAFLSVFGGWIFAFGLVWVCSEPNLFLHFNSFFTETLSIALTPWLLWSLCQAGKGKKFAALLALLSFLIATSKFQFALLPLLVLAAISFSDLSRERWLPRILLAAATGLAFAFSFSLASPQHRVLTLMNRYQAVFTGIAVVTNNPTEALSRLGIPENYHYLSGISLMDPPAQGRIDGGLAISLDRISLVKLATLYLTEPDAALNTALRLQKALSYTPLGYLGNYELATGRSGHTLEFPWQFSKIRDSILSYFPWLSWILAGLSLGILLRAWARKESFEPAHCLLTLLILHFFTQLVICVVGDGVYTLHRHLISARLSLDLMFWLMADRVISLLPLAKFSGALRNARPE